MRLNKCADCNNVNECEKSCMLHTGKALVDYIKRVDTVETRIGEYSSTRPGGKLDLVVSGHQVFDLKESPCWLLSDIKTTLGISDKFKKAFNQSASQLATIYCENSDISKEETEQILTKIKDINKNKQLILPLKPKADVKVDIDTENYKEKNVKGIINYIKWTTDKQTYQLRCDVGFKFDNWNKYISCSMSDYISKFRLSNFDFKIRGDKFDASLISLTEHGIIKPIVVQDKTTKIAIDGTYMYLDLNNEVVIIGYWDARDELKVSKKVKSKAFDKIMDNVGYIKDHKKYMAPYLLYEPNVIEV